jgi:hypothetical protein
MGMLLSGTSGLSAGDTEKRCAEALHTGAHSVPGNPWRELARADA